MSCFLPGDRLVERVAQKAFKGEISRRQIFFSSLKRLINRREKVKYLLLGCQVLLQMFTWWNVLCSWSASGGECKKCIKPVCV